jgi:sugar/nucleoside kinase (ribokinase family)
MHDRAPPTVVSLGTTVLDEIHTFDGGVIPDVAGGSGLYATVGARIATPPAEATSVGCLVLAGSDFPPEIEGQIRDWGVDVHMARQDDPGEKVARGRLRYLDPVGDAIDFAYTSPPLRATVADLIGAATTPTTPTRLLEAHAFHLFGPPEVVMNLVPAIIQAREAHGFEVVRPFFVWEPAPATCNVYYRDAHVAAAKLVDIFSPNEKELGALVGAHHTSTLPFLGSPLSMAFARQLVQDGFGPDNDGIIVVRRGGSGVSVLRRDVITKSYPPYHALWRSTPTEQAEAADRRDSETYRHDAVVNTTGAGNAFLGGFIMGWLAAEDGSDRIEEACVRGSVSASFTVEQVGMPVRSVRDGEELWNGVSAEARMCEFRDYIQSSRQQVGDGV